MLIRPQIAALRGNDSPQRQAQSALVAAMARWRSSEPAATVLAGLERYADGAPLAECPALAALFAPGDGAAADFVRGFVDRTTRVLAEHPLGQVATRHFTNGIASTLLFGHVGDATLTLGAIDGAGLAGAQPADSVSFAPSELREHVLAGEGCIALYTREPAAGGEHEPLRLARTVTPVAPGTILARDGRRQAALVERVTGRLVSLRLQRGITGAGPVHEYELASGRLIHRAAATPADSRRELMMALLGRMARVDAAPLLGAMARGSGRASDALRWQALRECLGLDTAMGFAALSAIAADAGDPLSGPAGALRAQLVEAYPQLGDVSPEMMPEVMACPA